MPIEPLCVEAEPIRPKGWTITLTAHRLTDHADGKPPWCNHCGRDAEYRVPATRFDSMVGAHRKAVSTRMPDRVIDTDAADD